MSSVACDYFDQLYQQSRDPWQVRSRWYEQRKRALLLAALPKQHYRQAFEPACGTGDLTLDLAERCDSVWASDFSADAVRIASERVAHLPNVRVQQQRLPRDWPDASFDLIVISEWAYYLSSTDLSAMIAACRASLAEDGALIACHWKPDFTERLQSTATVHAAFDAVPNWTRHIHHEETDFLLDAWSPCPSSLAQLEGLT